MTNLNYVILKNGTKLKLKKIEETNDYEKNICCIDKCNCQSEVIDATHKYSSLDLPLCDKHWFLIIGE